MLREQTSIRSSAEMAGKSESGIQTPQTSK
jgi:hypothetical protein